MIDQLTVDKRQLRTTRQTSEKAEVGSVFVSNYPPYSFWDKATIPQATHVLSSPPSSEATLGLYLHIPFCRKRCKFCYFRVFTDKNSSDVQTYLDALTKEIELYSEMAAIRGRSLAFVYFGGGTPSYISAKHLTAFVQQVRAIIPWDTAEEVTFECEPGTLTQTKLEAIKGIGVTRLSLGVENLNDEILSENGRAHLSKEVVEVMPWIEELDFDQVNIDLIAGMVGETWGSWRETVEKSIDLHPDSITVYQMELPFNALYSRDVLNGKEVAVVGWKTKREWHSYAFEQFSSAGYELSSAYTMIKRDNPHRFVYRDSVWRGNDMLGTGVASFSHINGTHFQNVASWDKYIGLINDSQMPLGRAFCATPHERFTRELILQLKLGRIEADSFRDLSGPNLVSRFVSIFDELRDQGFLTFDENSVTLTQKGLFQVDSFLPEFYASKYKNARYT